MFGHGNHRAERETAEGTGENWRTEAPQKEENGIQAAHRGSARKDEGPGPVCVHVSRAHWHTPGSEPPVPVLTSWMPSYWAPGTPRPRSSCVPVTCPPQIALSYLRAGPLPCRPPHSCPTAEGASCPPRVPRGRPPWPGGAALSLVHTNLLSVLWSHSISL